MGPSSWGSYNDTMHAGKVQLPLGAEVQGHRELPHAQENSTKENCSLALT